MKKSLLISLVILLAVSLGITMVPANSVAAGQQGGVSFHIKAEGVGDYEIINSESGSGEFSINVAGQKGWNFKHPGYSRGYGTPRDTVQGHISGSFGDHEIDLALMNPVSVHGPFTYNEYVKLNQDGKLERVGFKAKGTYDGNKVTSWQSYIFAYYNNGELDYIKALLAFTDGTTQTYLYITIYEASVRP